MQLSLASMQINKDLSVPGWYLMGHSGMLSKSVQRRVLQLLPVRLIGWSTVLWGQDCGFGWFEFLCSMATDFTTSQSQPAVPKICTLAHKADWVRKYRWVNSNLSPQLGKKTKQKKTGSTCPALSSCTVHSHHAPSSCDFVCCHFSSLRECDTAFYTSSL